MEVTRRDEKATEAGKCKNRKTWKREQKEMISKNIK
jgi:hypothetical protein